MHIHSGNLRSGHLPLLELCSLKTDSFFQGPHKGTLSLFPHCSFWKHWTLQNSGGTTYSIKALPWTSALLFLVLFQFTQFYKSRSGIKVQTKLMAKLMPEKITKQFSSRRGQTLLHAPPTQQQESKWRRNLKTLSSEATALQGERQQKGPWAGLTPEGQEVRTESQCKFPSQQRTWRNAILEPTVSEQGIWKAHFRVCLYRVLGYWNAHLGTRAASCQSHSVTKATGRWVSQWKL